MFKQLIYTIIYNRYLNYLIRNINKFLYPFLPNKIRIPPSGKISIKIDNKNLTFITNQTNGLTRLLFWGGVFEYTDIFVDLIKKGDCFFDIGANIGYYSLVAARVNPGIKIISFEPATGPLDYFKRNVRQNKFTNIKVESIALSDKTGEIEFYEVQNQKYKYLKHNLSGEGNTGTITTGRNFKKNIVSTISLDEYVEKNKINKIDIIKMDTEGTENIILNNSQKVLTEFKPIIICETMYNTIEDKLEDIVKPHGYEFYNHIPRGLQKVDSIRRTEFNGVSNCFFVPSSKVHLIKDYIVN